MLTPLDGLVLLVIGAACLLFGARLDRYDTPDEDDDER